MTIHRIATKVKNPMGRGTHTHTKCTYCNNWYTKLGISRHWDHCKSNPKNSQRDVISIAPDRSIHNERNIVRRPKGSES